MQQPGFEPGSRAWEAMILTTIRLLHKMDWQSTCIFYLILAGLFS